MGSQSLIGSRTTGNAIHYFIYPFTGRVHRNINNNNNSNNTRGQTHLETDRNTVKPRFETYSFETYSFATFTAKVLGYNQKPFNHSRL